MDEHSGQQHPVVNEVAGYYGAGTTVKEIEEPVMKTFFNAVSRPAWPRRHWGTYKLILVNDSSDQPRGMEWFTFLWNFDIFYGKMPLLKIWAVIMFVTAVLGVFAGRRL